jgi:hypothetical protein
LDDFRFINEAAYWDYQHEKIYVRTSKLIRRKLRKLGHFKPLPIDKTVNLVPPNICPSCRRFGTRRKIVHDLNIGKLGVRRSIKLYNLILYKCAICEIDKKKREHLEKLPKDKYGPSFTAFAIFLFIELAIPQIGVMHIFNNVFKFCLVDGYLAAVKRKASLFYEAPRQSHRRAKSPWTGRSSPLSRGFVLRRLSDAGPITGSTARTRPASETLPVCGPPLATISQNGATLNGHPRLESVRPDICRRTMEAAPMSRARI